nr:MAG TPA: Replication associated protein [Microviridae sp.]
MDKVDTIKFLAKRCYHGKNVINPYTGQLMYQPCGECPACLTRKASIRSMRVSLQKSLSKYAYFINPSYDQKYVPKCQIFKVHPDDPDSDLYELVVKPRQKGDYKIVQRVYSKKYKKIIKKEVDAPLSYDDDFSYYFNASDDYIRDFREQATLNVKGKYPHLQDYYGYISRKDGQLFVKRLRKHISKFAGKYEKVHIYLVSEYGPVHFRPHFHLLLFTDSDKVAKNISRIINSSWKFGRCDWSASRGNAESYVAGYVNSFSRLPYHLKQDDRVKPYSRFSNGFATSCFSDATQAVRDSISRPKEEAPLAPFLNGIPSLINGKLLSIRPPRSVVDSCFLRYACNGRLSSHELYWLVRSVSTTLSRSFQAVRRDNPGATLMDVCRLHLRSIYSMSSRSVEDFLSIENQLYTCYYYARLESPTTDVRSDALFDSDCMRLYRFFSCVGKFISFWNITPSSSYEYIYRTVDLSKWYYSRLSYYMLRSQYTDLVGLVDLDEELVDFLIAPVTEDVPSSDGISALEYHPPFESLVKSHPILTLAQARAKKICDDRVKHRDINDRNLKYV